jgi:hypothetical protein
MIHKVIILQLTEIDIRIELSNNQIKGGKRYDQ